MKRSLLALLALLALSSLPLSAAIQVDSLDLHLAIAGMREAEGPRVVDNWLVLSAKGPWRYVGVAFESEGFTQVHPFEKNRQGVFVYALPVPYKCLEPIAYRLVIDGVWTSDPLNPLAAEGRGGLVISLARVPYLSDEVTGIYRILGEDGRTAHFLFKGEGGMVVTLAGTFNNWDPFLYELDETSPGVYEIELPLPAGQHYYAFFYDGAAHPDPLNQDKATSRDGTVVSMLVVKPRR